MCLADAVVASWSPIQEVAGSSPFTVMKNTFVTEFSERFRKNSRKCSKHTLQKVTENFVSLNLRL